MINPALSAERIVAARSLIPEAFLNSRLLSAEALDRQLGLSLVLKDETDNPIRCFKGRGTSVFVARDLKPGDTLVAASAGNFGQGLADAGARAGHRIIVYAAKSANPVKVEAMRKLGAEVVLHGTDLDEAKTEARNFAERQRFRFVEDGAESAIAEGAGTLGIEMTEAGLKLDAIFLPLGNGALATGVGCWFKSRSPQTRIIAVASEGAPCMALSFAAGKPVETDQVATMADGVAVRVPVPYAVECMEQTVDDVMLVGDAAILEAMALVKSHFGRIVEPAGAIGLAGLMQARTQYAGKQVATVLCGGNVTQRQIAEWLPSV